MQLGRITLNHFDFLFSLYKDFQLLKRDIVLQTESYVKDKIKDEIDSTLANMYLDVIEDFKSSTIEDENTLFFDSSQMISMFMDWKDQLNEKPYFDKKTIENFRQKFAHKVSEFKKTLTPQELKFFSSLPVNIFDIPQKPEFIDQIQKVVVIDAAARKFIRDMKLFKPISLEDLSTLKLRIFGKKD